MNFLLNSVVLIDRFIGIGNAAEFIERHEGDIAISAMTRAEVLARFSASD